MDARSPGPEDPSSSNDEARPGANLRAVERLQVVGIVTLITGSIGLRVISTSTSVGDRWVWTLGVAFFVTFWAVFTPLGMRFSRMTFREVHRAAFTSARDDVRRWAGRLRRR